MKGNKWSDASKEPDTTSQKRNHMMGNNSKEASKELVATSQTGRQMKGRTSGKKNKNSGKNRHTQTGPPPLCRAIGCHRLN